ncbi:hypothetical protein FA13DRAFT_1739634 [Coprinellus micaceus]|uniref:Uncharacterized protein n=1 Tax=Coprinellus micaceus TaxID=71717 RepID=A0A4Y7SPL8_COPMI|nr:hypothetical protein FA13DRAFT_1739634 [Coprinellus micaceus]
MEPADSVGLRRHTRSLSANNPIRSLPTPRSPSKPYSRPASRKRSGKAKQIPEEAEDHTMGEPDVVEVIITPAITRKAIRLFTADRFLETQAKNPGMGTYDLLCTIDREWHALKETDVEREYELRAIAAMQEAKNQNEEATQGDSEVVSQATSQDVEVSLDEPVFHGPALPQFCDLHPGLIWSKSLWLPVDIYDPLGPHYPIPWWEWPDFDIEP